MFFNSLSTDRPKTCEPPSTNDQNLGTTGDQSAEIHQGAHVSMNGVWEF